MFLLVVLFLFFPFFLRSQHIFPMRYTTAAGSELAPGMGSPSALWVADVNGALSRPLSAAQVNN